MLLVMVTQWSDYQKDCGRQKNGKDALSHAVVFAAVELCLTLVLLMACLATFKKFEKMDFQYFFNIIPIPSAYTKRFFFFLLFHPIIILELICSAKDCPG